MKDGSDNGEWTSTELPSSWAWTEFSSFWNDHTDSYRKIQQKNYELDGQLAVVDQGAALIGGYTNELAMQCDVPLPAIVFGDHTRIVKFIDRPFAQGADGVRVLSPADHVDARFAYHALRCVRLPDKGYSRHFKFLKATSFPLAPLTEQRRIVAKIDSLTGKAKRARDHLDHIPRLVEKHKQAVLSAAFRGDLTRKWRVERALEWHGNELLKELCTSVADGDHQAPPKAASGIPFITISAMNDGVIDLAKATRYVPETYLNSLSPARRASKGNVLYSVTGSFGISALVDFDEPFVFQRHIAILKSDPRRLDAVFLFRMLSCSEVMEQAESVATGTAQRTVPLSGLRNFSIPAPSLAEQHEIVRRIELAFDWIDRLASETTSARRLVDRLDQAVLAKAFRGELVPQDPADEPASALLERIKAKRGASPNVRPGRRTKAPA